MISLKKRSDHMKKSFGINKLLPLVGAFWFILQGSGLL